MKVRVCPKCGSHNLENAWSCSGCGETLSLNTVVEIDSASNPDDLNAVIPESSISPYFYQDIAELFDTIVEPDETIICGYNITQPSNKPPHLFGYLIMTSRRLISVFFESEMSKPSLVTNLLNPSFLNLINLFETRAELKRPCIQPEFNSFIAVDYPDYPLTPKEEASRRVEIDMLGDLINVDYFRQESLLGITLRFTNDGKIITFCAPNHAWDMYTLLNHSLPQINGKKKMDQLEGVSPEMWLRGMDLEGVDEEQYRSQVPAYALLKKYWERVKPTIFRLDVLFGSVSGLIGVVMGSCAATMTFDWGSQDSGIGYLFGIIILSGYPLIGALLGALGVMLIPIILSYNEANVHHPRLGVTAASFTGFITGLLVGIAPFIGIQWLDKIYW